MSDDKDVELRRLRRWLAFSERLDRLIEAAERPTATVAAGVKAPLLQHLDPEHRVVRRYRLELR